MREYKVKFIKKGVWQWKPVKAETLEEAEKIAAKRWGNQVTSVTLIPKRGETA